VVLNPLISTPTPGGCGDESAFGKGYCVEQGPEWLAKVVVNPPGWVYAVLAALLGALLGFIVLAHRREAIGAHDVRDVLGSLSIVGAIGLSTLAVRELGWFGYLGDLAVGWAVGAVLGLWVARQVRADEPRGEAPDADPVRGD